MMWRVSFCVVFILASAARTQAIPVAGLDANGQFLERGKHIYARYCASCHGRGLQGQPLWRAGGRHAPPLDQSGPLPERTDVQIVQITKFGRPGELMPPFATMLSDDEILAVTAYVTGRLPLAIRVVRTLQHLSNTALPIEASNTDWTFPLDCLHPGSPPQRIVSSQNNRPTAAP